MGADIAALLGLEATLLKLSGVDLDSNGKFRVVDPCTDRLDNLVYDPSAVLQRPAVLVRPFVGGARKELRKEISVRTV